LLTLDRHAAPSNATMVLRSPPTVVTRPSKLVDLIALRGRMLMRGVVGHSGAPEDAVTANVIKNRQRTTATTWRMK